MVFNTLTQTFAFHSSPESFISSRLESLAVSEPDSLPSPSSQDKIITASLLNRTVHVASSYRLCKDIMDVSSSADPAALDACRSIHPDPNSRSRSLGSSTFSASSWFSSTTSSAVEGSEGMKGRRRRREEREKGRGVTDANLDSNPRLKPDTFVSAAAYDQLMADFFPSPNILLQDGPEHSTNRRAWESQMSTLSADIVTRVREIARKHVATAFLGREDDTKIDLYQALKSLSWEILLAVFLDLSPGNIPLSTSSRDGQGVGEVESSKADFAMVETLQETLLRGQFSLLPVSFNTMVWQSARSKGIQARKELQSRLKQILTANKSKPVSRCPLLKASKVSDEVVASHAILFTSSIAVKALASLLMASTMNLFLWRDRSSRNDRRDSSPKDTAEIPKGERNHSGYEGGKLDPSTSLADLIRSYTSSASESDKSADSVSTGEEILSSILLETERLSPPVIGLMRRVQHDIVLRTAERGNPDQLHNNSTDKDDRDNTHPVRAGQDIWLYLPLASRDPTVFGPDAGAFKWNRYYRRHPTTLTPPSSSSEDESRPPVAAVPEVPVAEIPEGLAFGTGPKHCLGTSLIRTIVLTVVEELIDSGLHMDMDGVDEKDSDRQDEAQDQNHDHHNSTTGRTGVDAWLGWLDVNSTANINGNNKVNIQDAVARHMKQLPVQRPRDGVWVRCCSPSLKGEGKEGEL